MELGREILVGYQELYPKYDVNTGLMFIKLAKLSNLLERTREALGYVHRGLDQLNVCYGREHPFVRDTVDAIRRVIEEALKEEEGEEDARTNEGDKTAVQLQSG